MVFMTIMLMMMNNLEFKMLASFSKTKRSHNVVVAHPKNKSLIPTSDRFTKHPRTKTKY